MLKTDLTNRIYGLDILRAVAILCVLVSHGLEFLPLPTRKILYDITGHGVTIFFVLSGFLIGRILIQTFNDDKFCLKSLFKFWLNRWIRTIPPYFISLTLLIIVIFGLDLQYQPHFSTAQFVRYYLFLQNFRFEMLPFFVESWSLPVEEWFYLLTPLFLLIFYKGFKLNLNKSIVLMVILITIFSLSLRIYRFYNGIPYENQVVTRMDSLMFGVLGAYIMIYKNISWNKYKNIFLYIGVTLLLASLVFGIGTSNYIPSLARVLSLTFVPVLVLFMLPYLNSIKSGKGFIYSFLTFISLISYSLYLFHHTLTKYIIVGSISKHLGTGMYINGFLYWGISIFIAAVMYIYIEKPCMDVRKKINFLRK